MIIVHTFIIYLFLFIILPIIAITIVIVYAYHSFIRIDGTLYKTMLYANFLLLELLIL